MRGTPASYKQTDYSFCERLYGKAQPCDMLQVPRKIVPARSAGRRHFFFLNKLFNSPPMGDELVVVPEDLNRFPVNDLAAVPAKAI